MSAKIFLQKLAIKDLLEEDKDFDLIQVPSNSTVIEVLRILGKYNISAVPVVDMNTNQVLGGIDLIDILCFAAAKMSETLPELVNIESSEFAHQTVKEILNFSGRNAWNDLSYKAPITEVLEILSKPDIHRVAVTNEQIDTIGLITQYGLIKFIHKNKDKYPEALKKTVSDIWGEKHQEVQSINISSFVMEALKIMRFKSVSGLAIVDDDGRLVGNISAGDLKNIITSTLEGLREDLHSQIQTFKNIPTDGDKRVLANLPRFDPITVTTHSTLEYILQLIVSHHIHRVYVVDTDKKPIRVISLCDVIAALCI